jgi:hypothetical protein
MHDDTALLGEIQANLKRNTPTVGKIKIDLSNVLNHTVSKGVPLL